MHTTTSPHRVRAATAAEPPELRPLLLFAAVAVLSGWVLLSVPLLLDLPDAPFVLATLLVGLVAPALVLSRRDPATSARHLLRQTLRRPRPLAVLLPALLLVPGLTWAGAALAGGEEPLDGALLASLVPSFLSSLLIVNVLEEMAWTGFFQQRAMARWGTVGGSLLTAVLFVGIHLPLAFHGDPAAGLAALVVSGVGLRLLVAGFWSWGGRSVLAVAVVHASFNTAEGVVDADHDWIRYAVTFALGLLVLATPAARR